MPAPHHFMGLEYLMSQGYLNRVKMTTQIIGAQERQFLQLGLGMCTKTVMMVKHAHIRKSYGVTLSHS